MIKLEWLNKNTEILITFSENESLIFGASSWHRAKISEKLIKQRVVNNDEDDDIPLCIFDSINKWLLNQNDALLNKLKDLYIKAFNILDMQTDIIYINNSLSEIILEIFNLCEWNSFREWLLEYGDLNVAIGYKEELGEKDSASLTYFTEDYKDIIVFSTLLKLIIPIWGMYEKGLCRVLDSDTLLMMAVSLIRNDYTDNNPAFIRLQQYVDSKIGNKNEIPGFSIIKTISQDEIPEYLFALALWKKICIFDVKGNNPIIKDIHAVLQDRTDRMSKMIPRPKKHINDRHEDVTAVEMYKITSRIPPAITVMLSKYIESIVFIQHVEQDLDIEEVINKRRFVDKNLAIRNFHISIVSLVCGKHLGIRSTLLLDYETLVTTILVTSEALKILGFNIIAELLVTVPEEKDIYSFTINGSKPQIPIPTSIINKLDNDYIFCHNTNPALNSIDCIMKEVNNYLWNISNYEKLLIELANLYLWYNQNKREIVNKKLALKIKAITENV